MVGLTLGQGVEISVSEYNSANSSETKILSESQFLSLRESLPCQVNVPRQKYLCWFCASESRLRWTIRARPLRGTLVRDKA